MELHLAVQTLGFATGVVLFSLLVVLSRRAEKQMRGTWSGTWAALMGLVWNAANLCEQIGLLSGLEDGSWFLRLAIVTAWSAAAVLPVTILLLLRPLVSADAWNSPEGRWFFRASCVLSAILTAGLSLALLNEWIGAYLFTFQELTAYNFLVHALAGAVVFRRTRRDTGAKRRYSLTMLLLLAGLGSGALVALHAKLNPSATMLLDIAIKQSSIPMALATFVFLARFRLADVFVKRSLTLLIAAGLVFLYGLLIVQPILQMIGDSSLYPKAGVWIVGTVLWCALLLAFPQLDQWIRRGADKWIFQRPDYRHLIHLFHIESDSVESEAELFTMVDNKIRTAFGEASSRFLPYERLNSFVQWTSTVPDDVIHVAPEDPVREVLGDPQPETLVPIVVKNRVEHVLAVTAGERGRKLLNDETQFLLALAERIGRKIEALEFEQERRKQEIRESSLKQLLTEAELKALRAQVNPHFLFNTLNTIMDLIGSEPEKAELMTERLAEVFRYVLNLTDRQSITIAEEVAFLRTYLEIEHARFGDRLHTEISIDSSVGAMEIPPLLLQPLVENSIKHGLGAKGPGGKIRISVLEQGQAVRIMVEDDGIGFRNVPDWRSFPSGGIGLRNVYERVRTAYGKQAEMSVQSEPGNGTKICIEIPRSMSPIPVQSA